MAQEPGWWQESGNVVRAVDGSGWEAGTGLVCGGYFLVRPSPAPDWTHGESQSSPVLSLSDCICPSVSAHWASPWVDVAEEERLREAAAFGLGPGTLPSVLDWFDQSMETAMGWPNVFRSVWAARCFARRFLTVGADVYLVGLGLAGTDVARLLRDASRSDESWAPGGILEMIAAGLPPEPGGEALGWEVLGFDHGGFHSWFCNRLEVEVEAELGIRPGALGLIARGSDALAVADYAAGDPGVEPGVWLAGKLLSYPIASPAGAEADGERDERHPRTVVETGRTVPVAAPAVGPGRTSS